MAVAGGQHVASVLPKDTRQRLSASEGIEEARPHDWIYLDLADLDAGDFDATFSASGRAVVIPCCQ